MTCYCLFKKSKKVPWIGIPQCVNEGKQTFKSEQNNEVEGGYGNRTRPKETELIAPVDCNRAELNFELLLNTTGYTFKTMAYDWIMIFLSNIWSTSGFVPPNVETKSWCLGDIFDFFNNNLWRYSSLIIPVIC